MELNKIEREEDPRQSRERLSRWQERLRRGSQGYAPPCIGERTISFLVKIKSSVLCTPMAYIDHLGYFIQYLINKKVVFRLEVFKKFASKTGKMRKWPKTANFGHVLVFLSD